MAKIEDLVRQVSDERLRNELASEVRELKKHKRFGLVFEEHLPEMLRLPKAAIRVGNLVAHRDSSGSEVWRVIQITGKKAKCRQPINPTKYDQEVLKDFPLDELVLVVSFGEPIYPVLTPIDRVERGGPDKPRHVIINADNYHALQLLLYSHERKIDLIYIDPPYNTGARDWKYNNNYVDKTDAWRHSKWLSMMKKRLSLAQRLLKPNGVFVITIDDNESHHLRSLIDEMFPSALVHQITVVINPGGTYRINFARVHEYALYVCPNSEEVVQPAPIDRTTETTWKLRRTGSESSKRHQRPNQFYPIVVDKKTSLAKRVGPPLSLHEKWRPYENDREVHVYPIDSKGVERVWRYAGETMMKHVLAGNVYGRKQPGGWNCYLRKEQAATARLKTMWYQGEHSSVGTAGIVLVDTILQTSAAFSFPKSLYLVRDSLAAIVRDNRDAVILDFFAGSGTTLHATALLNDEDDGRRQCILVTNNELFEKQAAALRNAGLYPGDPNFEKHGICESVTWPRCKYAIQGHRDDGSELPGKYLNEREMSDGFDESVEYFRLDFVDPADVERGDAFEGILPILWLMSGAIAVPESRRGSMPWYIAKHSPFAVLIQESKFRDFQLKLNTRKDLINVFLITDSDDNFAAMRRDLGRRCRCVQLYKSYLENFRINTVDPRIASHQEESD